MPAGATSWGDISLVGDPFLFVGWRRSNNRLETRYLPTHLDVRGELLDICSDTLQALEAMEKVPYSPYSLTEPGEQYLEVDNSTTLDGADIVAITTAPGGIPDFSPGEFEATKFGFYGISFASVAHGRISFIRKTDPKRALDRGHRYYKYGDVLKKLSQPDIVLEEDVDFVVSSASTAVLRMSAFSVLTNDIAFARANVDAHVSDIESAFSVHTPLAPLAIDSITGAAKKKTSIAKRLPNIVDLLRSTQIDATSFSQKAMNHGLPANRFLSPNGTFEFEEEHAAEFLDIVEGRYYYQDFTNLAVRAIRFSPR